MQIIKSKIRYEFSGWSGNTIFELENGQIWKQCKYSYWYYYEYRPNVTIIYTGNRGKMTVCNKTIEVEKIR